MALPILPDSSAARHLPTPENRRSRMAKADLRKTEWRLKIGGAIRRAMVLQDWSLKELAGAVDRDERQCARWMDGSERPQFDTLFAVATFRHALIVAFAELGGEAVETTTVITIRRIA